jgi:hypothetical protein
VTRTNEQAVRDILDAAVRAGLVVPAPGRTPQGSTAGELVGPANVLGEFVRELAAGAGMGIEERPMEVPR